MKNKPGFGNEEELNEFFEFPELKSFLEGEGSKFYSRLDCKVSLPVLTETTKPIPLICPVVKQKKQRIRIQMQINEWLIQQVKKEIQKRKMSL